MSSLGLAPARPALDTQLRRVMIQAVEDTGLSRAEIARRAGLNKSTVSQLLLGRRSGTIETWDLVLAAAGVQLGYRVMSS